MEGQDKQNETVTKFDETETHEAFTRHFEEQLDLYKKISIITLAELSGKEAVLSDAFLSHVIQYNSSYLTFITFDFHEYCRGMKFENVSLLTEGLKDVVKDMRYCWVDDKGLICEQRGVFRVNCIDCLDRTNVVQTAIARIVMETQFRKLGLLPPEEMLPQSCRVTYQQLWANNGDAISRQYAGTAALKGDFTRTGERKLAGMMKDGMNSANRYYLRFRDDYRQAVMDIILGQPVSPEVLSSKVSDLDEVDDTSELIEKEENVKLLIEDCKKMLIVEPEQCLGGWSLIDADPHTGDPERQEMDIILLLSQRAVYVCWYDDEEDQVTQYQKIYVEDIEKLEIGCEPAIFKSRFVCLRIYYHCLAEEGFFHTFRVPSTRLFNNVIIAVKNQEEAKESLRAIGQSFIAGQEILSMNLDVIERTKLERKRTRAHPEVMDIHKQQQENALASIQLPRDISTDIPQPLHSTAALQLDDTSVPEQHEEKTSPNRNPIEFLQAAMRGPFKKPTLPSFPGPSIKQSFPTFSTPSIKLNFSKPTFNSAAKVAAKFTSVFYHPDREEAEGEKIQDKASSTYCYDNIEAEDMLEVKATEDIDEEVVLGSCGILATSPSQLLLNTKLRNKEKRLSRQRIRSTSESESEVIKDFDRDEINSQLISISDDKSTVFVIDNISHNNSENITDQSSRLSDFENKLPPQEAPSTSQIPVLKIDLDPKEQTDISEFSSKNKTDEDKGILEDEHASKTPVVKKSDHLHHPSMKISLSDTSLSTPLELDRKASRSDANPFVKLKLKMSNITLPGSSGAALTLKPPPLKSRTVLKKSQRLMEVFEDLVHSKLGKRESETRYIFI